MSESITKGSEIPKLRTRELLTEASKLDLTPPSQTLSREELKQQYEIKSRIVKEKITHLEYYAGLLETANQKWLDIIQNLTIATKRKEEEAKYANMVDDLQGDALLAVRGYDIAPENYDVIIGLLMEKYGKPFIIRKSLYNELNSIRRNDRDWKATIEAMERMLRQLEAIGENLEHLTWIVDKLYQLKEELTSCKNIILLSILIITYPSTFIIILLSILCFDIHQYFLLSSHGDSRQRFVHPQFSLMLQTFFINFQTKRCFLAI
uniref:Uncharacterized protein n=1 Tax=Wuchereria bancrofti TaxID=6293 RepID=A0AAF5RWV5_WUCBA